MTNKGVVGLLILFGLCLSALLLARTPPPSRRISLAALEDKIRGGWAGQMIGVSYGAPTEFRSNGKIIEGRLPWTPDRVSNSISQDDLYVEMTFAETLDRLGLDASTEQLGEAVGLKNITGTVTASQPAKLPAKWVRRQR